MSAHLDRDKAREALQNCYGRYTDAREGLALRALEACVVPDPPTTIDHDALTHLLLDGRAPDDAFALRGAILGLVRPVQGVVLTDQEAKTAAAALRSRANELRYRARINPVDASVMGTDTDALRALADRLEASA